MVTDKDTLLIWSDEHICVINKPAGTLTLPDGYSHQIPHIKSILEPDYGPLWIVHRLDRETSGVMVLARSAESHRSLNEQFATRQVTKVYHALVIGNPARNETDIRLPLRVDGDRQHRTLIDREQGKPSETHFKVLQRFGRYALVEATPHTGRRHQIRSHLATRGYPIAADPLYGDGQGIYLSHIKPEYKGERSNERALLSRLGLHARILRLMHPYTNAWLTFEAEYPKDISLTLKQLRRYSLLT